MLHFMPYRISFQTIFDPALISMVLKKSRIQSKVTPNYSKYFVEIKFITYKKYNGSKNNMNEKKIMKKNCIMKQNFNFD